MNEKKKKCKRNFSLNSELEMSNYKIVQRKNCNVCNSHKHIPQRRGIVMPLLASHEKNIRKITE